jgi:hypothetical protein
MDDGLLASLRHAFAIPRNADLPAKPVLPAAWQVGAGVRTVAAGHAAENAPVLIPIGAGAILSNVVGWSASVAIAAVDPEMTNASELMLCGVQLVGVLLLPAIGALHLGRATMDSCRSLLPPPRR